MLEITHSALTNIKDYLRQQKVESPIRVTMLSGGCDGPSLRLAIDEAKENDDNFDHDGVTFVVEKSLFATCGKVTVDFIEKSAGGCGCGASGGFTVTSEKPLSGGGCSCSCTSGSYG